MRDPTVAMSSNCFGDKRWPTTIGRVPLADSADQEPANAELRSLGLPGRKSALG